MKFICMGITLIFSQVLQGQQVFKDDHNALIHANEILESTPLIDGHNDLPWTIRTNPDGPRDVNAYDLRKTTPGDTDLERLRKGHIGAQFWSVFIPGEITEGYAKVQLEQIDIARRMIMRYPDRLLFATSSSDIEKAFQSGRIASFLGMEGGHAIENSLGALRSFYALGARYMTLTHNVTLDWADAAMDKPKHNGLTKFGEEVVREMNRLGMLVDLSHVTPEVMSDVLDISETPVIFSHSSARALTDHVRNVPDSILSRLAENGGVVMVTFIPFFVSQEVKDWQEPLQKLLEGVPYNDEWHRIKAEYHKNHSPVPKATLMHVANHIDHVRKIAGLNHVAIGSDFWGSKDMPIGLEDTSKFPYLFAELIQRGWKDSDLKKLAGENTLRVLIQAEAIALSIQNLRPASTATIQDLDK